MGVICETITPLVRMNELKFRVVCQDCPQSNFRRPLIAKDALATRLVVFRTL